MLLKLFNLLIFFTLIIITANQFTQYEPANNIILNKELNSKIINNQSLSDKHHQIDQINFHRSIDESSGNRVKRQTPELWIKKGFENQDEIVKMHALIVRDENIPPCCTTSKVISQTRHFMCSGALLTTRHAITSASCMHFADVYEHHVNADLAVVIGAFSPTPYVIKIDRYEMHPYHVYDVESKDLSTHDLAILHLNCSILTKNMIIPRLPKGFFDDIGHVCCGIKCQLMTVVQYANHHHVAKILTAKFLPSPNHTYEYPVGYIGGKRPPMFVTGKFKVGIFKKNNLTSLSKENRRVKKSAGRLAGTPSFFSKTPYFTRSYRSKNMSEPSEIWKYEKIQNIFDEIENARREISNKNKEKKEKAKKLAKLRKEKSNASHKDEEMITSIDWKKIEERLGSKLSNENREKMEKFTKNLVDATMKRVGLVVDTGISKSRSKSYFESKFEGLPESTLLQSFLPPESPSHKHHNITDFALAFAKILKSVAASPDNGKKLMVSSDLFVDENNLGPPPPKYVHCPPLGTPIFKDGILIAMISYTCDDVQSWVEWKYVSISRNMNWIRRRISTAGNRKPIIRCM